MSVSHNGGLANKSTVNGQHDLFARRGTESWKEAFPSGNNGWDNNWN